MRNKQEKLIPIAQVDQAVRTIELFGTAQEKEALCAAIELWTQRLDRRASRRAIVAVAERVRARRRAP